MTITKENFQHHVDMLDGDLDSLVRLTFTHNRPVSLGDVRLASVILRKWLIGGLFARLCRVANVMPTFPILDADAVWDVLPNESRVNFFLTGGVNFNAVGNIGIYNSTVPWTGAALIPIENIKMKELTLGELLGQRRVYFSPYIFRSEDIIKYIANKLGGAHLDFNRAGLFAEMDRAAEFMLFGGPTVRQGEEPPSEVYMIVEPEGREIFNAFHIEIQALSAAFVQVKLNGQPYLPLFRKRGLLSRIRSMFGGSKLRVVHHDHISS